MPTSFMPQPVYPFPVTRRDAIRIMTGTAGCAALAQGSVRSKVGIVGGGMAGVSLAWLLDGNADVVLLESRDTLGGNVQSVIVDLDGLSFPVDLGAQYFHPGPYPTYVKLLTYLGLFPTTTQGSRSFPASITLDATGEVFPHFLSPILPGRAWPLLASWNAAGVEAFAVGFEQAKLREEQGGSWSLTLGAWLQTLGLTNQQWEGMLLPWAASLFSGDIEQARGLSARAAMIFAAKALPDNPLQPLLYYILNQGMIEALHRMAAQFTSVQVLTGAVVDQVLRETGGGFTIHCSDGRTELVDDLVFASSGPSTLSLLEGLAGTALQRAAVAGIEFHDAHLVLHTDPLYAPANPDLRSFFNCRIDGAFAEASMWMRDVLPIPPSTASKIWKSWATHRSQLPSQILAETWFKHMLPTPASLVAQSVLHGLQGAGGIWFAGGYTLPYDSQETALLSSLFVATQLAGAGSRAQMLVN